MSVERMNALLERLGSEHRVQAGDRIDEGLVAFCEALERSYERTLRDIEQRLHHLEQP